MWAYYMDRWRLAALGGGARASRSGDRLTSLGGGPRASRSAGGALGCRLARGARGIKGAEYSYAKSPRWKSGIGLAVAVGIFALPVFFMKGKKHWLTIAAEKDFAVLRLDKNNYRIILPTFEARTGKRVEAVAEEK